MNLKIKYRESFRPFAPSVLRERVSDYFEMDVDSPYMLLVAPVRQNRRIEMNSEQKALWGIDLLNVPRPTFRRSRMSITRRESRPCTRTRIRAITAS